MSDAESLIKEARATIDYFDRVEAACAKQMQELQEAKAKVLAVSGAKGKIKDAMRAIGIAESKVIAGAKAASEARSKITESLLAVQAGLEKEHRT